MNTYEERKYARAERYQRLAKKAKQRQLQLIEESDKLVEHIPPGQPILVGHHSEQRHRRTLERSHNKMFQSLDEAKKVKYYEQKAEAVLNNRAISSDDPEAIQKLKAKIEAAEQRHARMKAANKIIKNKKFSYEEKVKRLQELGYASDQADTLLHPDCMGDLGYAGYALSNSNANIRRMKQRLEELEAQVNDETNEIQIGDVKIVENVEENRCQIFFPAKPSKEFCRYMRHQGFRWSRYNGCWQRHRSNAATYQAERAAQKFMEEEV